MKILTTLMLLFLTTTLFCQELKTLIPVEGKKFDFGLEVQNEWKKRDQLLDQLHHGKKKWDNLTKNEKNLLDKYDESYSGMWDVMSGGCSWYCGAGEYSVSTSSELSSNGTIDYKSENLTDFNYETAWVEGKNGYGIGETIIFSFVPTHPRITSILISNGYIKNKKTWKENSRVHKLKMYVNNKAFSIIELKDIYAEQIIELEKPLGYYRELGKDVEKKYKDSLNWEIKFEILSVYKGDKYDDTVISELYFDGLDVHCLAKGTLITMSDYTLKNIEDLIIGDKILSFNKITGQYENSEILELASQAHKDLIEIEFSNGIKITCTKDHPFLTNKLNWSSVNPEKTEKDYELINVLQLKLGTKIKTLKSELEVVKINEIKEEQITYTIVNLNNNNTFIANGIITGIEKLRLPK